MRSDEIGYVCSRGHFLFEADDEEIHSCGSRRVAGIKVDWELQDLPSDDADKILQEAEEHLRQVIEAWRDS